jgi:hypothetical protein
MLLPRVSQLLATCLVVAAGTWAAVEYHDPDVKSIPVRKPLFLVIEAHLTNHLLIATYPQLPTGKHDSCPQIVQRTIQCFRRLTHLFHP